jgi:putative hydroxymethylpyrimidine transport system substrate-binding protein
VRRVAAPLAAVLAGLALASCGGDGAEPGAPEGATLVLDFQPNAVHTAIYAAQAHGYFEDKGLDLTIRKPSGTADSAKLLASGRATFAVMDINDYGIARKRGLNVVAFGVIVQRPLASVIARDRDEVRTPADLAGKTVGVTGVPSDDAVLDTVLRAGGVDPSEVRRVTIGFNAVAQLAAGKIDAATAFWNAEGVQLRRLGIPTREFRVDEFGAPRYPELVIVADPGRVHVPLARKLVLPLARGYRDLADDPDDALMDLLDSVPELDADEQRAQLDALIASHAFTPEGDSAPARLDSRAIDRWRRWARSSGLLTESP